MKTVGIICEYNPFHLGHAGHIEKTRNAIGSNIAVVCVMSGNYVQRGDFAIFNKHARAKMAASNGADLVIELPTPYVLQSAEGFAKAGVHILDKLGTCDHLSFGSESGNIDILHDAAMSIVSDRADMLTKEWLDKGVSYAFAQQKAADALMGARSEVFKSPNNVLGIEYIKALKSQNSSMRPITVQRTGGEHDSDTGFSASGIRKKLLHSGIPVALMPGAAVAVCMEELVSGRGPVTAKNTELAILSRLRVKKEYSDLPGATEGLERRFERYVSCESTVDSILKMVKTKRYPMSRIRRMLMCAVLGIKKEDTRMPPPYIRVLAMNKTGMKLLRAAEEKSELPIITKPASVNKQCEQAIKLFNLEAAATDFYVLGYQNENERRGGREWRQSPIIVKG